MFPQVDRVDFVERPPGRSADRVAVYQRSGALAVMTGAELDSLLAVHPIE